MTADRKNKSTAFFGRERVMKQDKRNSIPKAVLVARQDQLESAFLRGAIGRRRFIATSLALGFLSASRVKSVAQTLEEIKTNQASQVRSLAATYDYVVCGAGSAACALVGRLASDGRKSILVIEAGGWDDAPSVLDPRLWFTNLDTERDWGDACEPSADVNDQRVVIHTGKLLGGGSSINATIWARPFKSDFDYWAEATHDERWNYESALSAFRRIENWQGVASERYRGRGGPVWCQTAHDPSPLALTMLDACRALGHPINNSLNGEREETGEGFALTEQIIRDGQRQNMAKSYLYPVLAQANVTLLTNAHVDRIALDKGIATGVDFTHEGERRSVAANREVILCSGAFRTPQLLMLSGIGDQDHLKSVGIEPLVHSPEVGMNLQDHILHGSCLWEAPQQIEHRNSGAEVLGYLKSDPTLDRPDISLVQVELPYASAAIGKAFGPTPKSWALCAGLMVPKSRGRVLLKTSNPKDRPVIEANYLSHPDDLAALERSIAVCLQIGNSEAMKPFAVREIAPGKELKGEELANFARDGVTTYSHPSGTCRMGADPGAVVDAELRVNGVGNLRIADSSIMPRIPACATMATCVFIGERLAELLVTPG